MRFPGRFPLRGMRQASAAVAVAAASAMLMGQYGGGADHWWEAGSREQLPVFASFGNNSGELMVYNKDGAIATENHPFFADLGVNGRACVTCHQPANAMSLGTERLNERWVQTEGRDPIFAKVDGSNCPSLPQQEKSSHSLLLQRGLFRIYLPWPATGVKPEFTLEVVRDPTGCNTDPVYGLNSAHPTISVFRRPRMVGNLKYVLGSADMLHSVSLAADGRDQSLKLQAIEAAQAHEQTKRPLTRDELEKILDFESQVFVAQTMDFKGGDLDEVDGPETLGAWNLARGKVGQDIVSDARKNAVFFAANDWKPSSRLVDADRADFRESVLRGNAIFSSRQFLIRDTANLTVGSPQKAQQGTCATCHSSRLTGSNADQRPMDVGTTNPEFTDGSLNAQGLPLFKVTCNKGTPGHPFLGRVIYTTDPGRALITGKCSDVGSIVAQQLRGLAARAPYFSNGSAARLEDVVTFYDLRYELKLSAAEKQDLVNFLSVL